MSKLMLPVPEGYDVATSPIISNAAAELDALLAALTRRMEEAPRELLEWQLRPGVNTIGMLLAHLAIVEVFWVQCASRGIDSDEEVNEIVQGILGIRIEADGMPLAEGGVHPRALAGKSAADYLELLGRARSATHRVLLSWNDRRLSETPMVDGREVCLSWILYHLVEHFAYHLGQIGLLISLRGGNVQAATETSPTVP